MNLKERERKIAIGVIAAVIALLLYYFVYQPYSDARDEVLKSQSDLQDQLDHARTVFAKQRRLQTVWTDMKNGGLNVDPARAERQTLDALNRWARITGFTLVT